MSQTNYSSLSGLRGKSIDDNYSLPALQVGLVWEKKWNLGIDSDSKNKKNQLIVITCQLNFFLCSRTLHFCYCFVSFSHYFPSHQSWRIFGEHQWQRPQLWVDRKSNCALTFLLHWSRPFIAASSDLWFRVGHKHAYETREPLMTTDGPTSVFT